VTQADLAIILSQPWVERSSENRADCRSWFRCPVDLRQFQLRRSATVSPSDFVSLQLSPG
jgi:hypothetical protein